MLLISDVVNQPEGYFGGHLRFALCFYPEFLQRAESGVETVLRQAAGQQVDPRLLRSLSVHFLWINIKVLQ